MRRFPRRESCSRRNKDRPDGCPACFAFWAGSLRRHTFCQQRQKYAKNAARNRMVSGLPLSAPHVSGCWDTCRAVESTMQGALNVVSSLRAPSCQPISDRYAAANRDTSSKPPRFIHHWRRFVDFQKPSVSGALLGTFPAREKCPAGGADNPILPPILPQIHPCGSPRGAV